MFLRILLLWLLCQPLLAQRPDLTLLQLNDVYELTPLSQGRVGGLARVATLRRQLLQEGGMVYTVLCGDFLSPSVFNRIALDSGSYVQGLQMVQTLDALGLDLVILGNHEYDHGEQVLVQRLQQSRFGWLSSNVQHRVGDSIVPFAMRGGTAVPRYQMLPVPTARGIHHLMLMGLTLSSYTRPWLAVTDVQATAGELIDHHYDPQPDGYVALTHQYIADDRALAQAMGGQLDLILGGHDHNAMADTVQATPIYKADANVKTVYVHRFYWNADSSRFDIRSTLVPIDERLAEDSATAAMAEKWMQHAYASLRRDLRMEPTEVIYHAHTPLEGTEQAIRSRQTNLGQMIARSMLRWYPDARLAILGSGSIRVDDNLQGDITQWDVARTLPFGGKVVAVNMTGEQLVRLLEAGERNKGTGGYLQYASARTQPGGAAPVQRKNGVWLLNGKPVKKTKDYPVVLNEYLLTGMEKNLEWLTVQAVGQLEYAGGSEADIRILLVHYLKQR